MLERRKIKLQKNMNKKDEKFMLSKYYCKDKGELQTNGLFSGKAITKIIIQKKHMREEIKIIHLNLTKIYNDEESDFYILQDKLNKLVQAEYKFFKFFKQYILKFTKYLEMESQYFKFWVNKEAKHEVFEKAVLPSVILEDG